MKFRPKGIVLLLLWSVFVVLAGTGAEAGRLRIVGGNITSGNLQSYDQGHGARIFKGLAPDVVLIQEFNYGSNSMADIREFVTNTFGADFHYFREAGAQIPNGIISRYPILESGEWDDEEVSNRDFSWARIDVPGSKDLWAVSVHFLTSSSSVRNTEARALVAYIRSKVPDADYLVIGGDFNSDARTESQFDTLADVVDTDGPHPVDRNGNANTNANRNKPYDSVFPDGHLQVLQTPVVIGGSTFANGLVADTRVYSPISEISPATTSDSGATNMQHMAIVKDFLLPEPLLITSTSPLAPGTLGPPLSRTLTASGGTTPYTWSVTSGTPPAGMTLSSGGVLSGRPTAAGTFTFTAKVTDAAAVTASQSFSITITPTLVITTSPPIASGTVGSALSRTLAATGGTSPYAWSVQSGAVPAGLTLSAEGTLAGTPSAAGTFTFTAKVTDNVGAVATKSIDITITPTLAAANPSSLPRAIVGAAYSEPLSATGGTSPYTWTLVSGSLPGGLALESSGAIVGTPIVAGTFTATAKVTDSLGATATSAISVKVEEPFAVYLADNGLPAGSATADEDDDGVPNVLEFLLAGDPEHSDPQIRPVLAVAPDGLTASFTFTMIASPGSVTWKVQSSTLAEPWIDLVDGQNGASIVITPDGGLRHVTVTVPLAAAPAFFRLSATSPATPP